MVRKTPPDPFKPGFAAEMNLSRRPLLAEALGKLCAEWANMELRMFAVFATLTGAPLIVSRTIFYGLNTTRTRVDILKAVAAAVLGRTEKFEEFDRLLGSINRSARKRNPYIHDVWASPTDDDAASAQMRLSGDDASGELEETEPKDLLQLANQARIHADNLVKWINAVEPSLPALLEKHRSQQKLALALTRRDSRSGPLLEVS